MSRPPPVVFREQPRVVVREKPLSEGVVMSSAETAAPDRLAGLLAEHAALETELADPAVHADQARARRLGRRYAQLAPIVETARGLDAARDDLAAARELTAEDPSFAAEATALEARIDELSDRLREQLLPKDL